MMKDMSIKDGEKIHIKVSTHARKEKHTTSAGGGGGLLRPPPPPGSVVTPSSLVESAPVGLSAATAPTLATVPPDDEWGDFTS